MSKVLTSLELKAIIRELTSLIGTKVSRIQQTDSHTLLITFHQTGGIKHMLKIDSGVGAYLTTFKFESPLMPPTFCFFLRKHLNQSRLEKITQKGLERIIELQFNTKEGVRILICELFSKGNFILCDGNYKILNVAATRIMKARKVKTGETYIYPPEQFNVITMTRQQFAGAFHTWKDHEIVKMLASGLGFGGLYAEEVCLRAEIDKNKIAGQMPVAEQDKIYAALNEVLKQFQKKLDPEIIYSNGEPIEAVPFKLQSFKNQGKSSSSFNQAIDVLLSTRVAQKVRASKDSAFQSKLARLETIYDKQKRALEQYQEDYEKNKRLADEIYNQYAIIQQIYNKIKSARDAGHDWYTIRDVLEQEKTQGIREAQLVNDVLSATDEIKVDLAGGITLDMHTSLESNAEKYYEKAKSSKAKITGAEATVAKALKDIKDLRRRREEASAEIEESIPKQVEVVRKRWYEKFHWFYTSSGLLAVGGRDATTNDILIKKHMEIKDLVFHTILSGSPFFLLKDGRDKAKDEDIQQVATATVSYSRSWSSGLSAADVFWVKPEQVTKDAPSGEYLSKGSFMVRGKKNQLRNTELQISIGLDKDDKIIAGPMSAIQRVCQKHVTVRPGDLKKSEVAKYISTQLDAKKNIDEIMRSLPGDSSIVNR